MKWEMSNEEWNEKWHWFLKFLNVIQDDKSMYDYDSIWLRCSSSLGFSGLDCMPADRTARGPAPEAVFDAPEKICDLFDPVWPDGYWIQV